MESYPIDFDEWAAKMEKEDALDDEVLQAAEAQNKESVLQRARAATRLKIHAMQRSRDETVSMQGAEDIVTALNLVGVKIETGGCGCCGDPLLRLEICGIDVLAGLDLESLNSWPENEPDCSAEGGT